MTGQSWDRRWGKSWGPLWIVIAAMLWGLSAFTKKTLLQYVDPALLNVLNSLCVCLTLVLVWMRPRALWAAFRQYPLRIIALGFFGTTIGTTFLYKAIDALDLSVASIVGKLQPVFTIVMASIFLGERMTRSGILWSSVAVVGACLVSVPEPLGLLSAPHVTVVGLLAAIVSCAGWAVSGVIGRGLSLSSHQITPGQLTFFRYFIGSSLVLPTVDVSQIAVAQNHWPYALPFVLSILVLALLTTALPTWCYYRGLQTVSAGHASVLELVSPLTAVSMGVVFLGERLSMSQMIGVVVVIIAVVSLERGASSRPAKDPTPDPSLQEAFS